MLMPSAGARAEPSARASKPQRIVSLNLCTDQLLVDLVSKDRIAALSHLAADPLLSAIAERASGMRLVRGAAEEVLALAPDLVLTSEHSTPATVALLQRLGVPVVSIPMASDLAGIRKAIHMLAEVVGEDARGAALIANFDARIARASPRSPARPTALAYQINSLTSGPGGLIDAALDAAGFLNIARQRPLGPAGRLPLETLITRPPDLLVLAHDPDVYRTASADNLRHRAFRDLLARRRHVHLPMPLWLCGTPAIAGAIEELARERESLQQAAAGGRDGPVAGVLSRVDRLPVGGVR